MRKIDCCRNCYDRHPLCHADCQKKAEVDEMWKELKEERRKNSDIIAYTKESKTKRLKRKNLK